MRRAPRREIDGVNRKRQVHLAAAVVTRHEAAGRFERAGIAALKQQQHRLLAGVERHQPVARQHRRRVEE